LFDDFFRAFYIDNQAGDGKGKRIPAGRFFCQLNEQQKQRVEIEIVLEKNPVSFSNTVTREYLFEKSTSRSGRGLWTGPDGVER
jgi:hypothetical protein